jgi:hypothetical protein
VSEVVVGRAFKIGMVVAVGVSLIAIPALAFSSSNYQQQATKYINNNCRTRVSDLTALRCFLYARTQELGQSIAGLQGDVTGIKAANANQDTSLSNLNGALASMQTNTLAPLQTSDATQNTALNAISQEVASLKTQVAALSGAGWEVKQFRKTASIAVNQPLVLTSSCPEGWTMTGGGGYFAANGEQPHGEVVLMTSHPLYQGFTDSPNTWHVAGLATGTLVAPTTAEAVAICKSDE